MTNDHLFLPHLNCFQILRFACARCAYNALNKWHEVAAFATASRDGFVRAAVCDSVSITIYKIDAQHKSTIIATGATVGNRRI